MNKRLKILIFVFLAVFVGLMVSLQPKVNAAFSKDSVIFNSQELGIMAPDSIPDNTTIVQMRCLDKSKTYTVQSVGYSEDEFQTVSYYLKQAIGMQNEASAELKKAQEEQKWYKELSEEDHVSASEKEHFEELYEEAVQREQDVKDEYTPKVKKAIQDYVDNAIRYPEDSKWVSLNSDYSIERDKLDNVRYYMLWLKAVDSSGTEKTSPVLYSPPGTLQMVSFSSKLKTDVKSIDIKENYLLENDVSYNKRRKDEDTKWTSSDTSILKVNSDGVITGVSNGYAIVTAENEKSRDCIVVFVTGNIRETPMPSPSTGPSTSPSGDSGITIKRDGSNVTISQGPSTSLPGTTSEQKGDNTVAKGTYPKAGAISLVVVVSILIFSIIYVIIQNYRMRDIK